MTYKLVKSCNDGLHYHNAKASHISTNHLMKGIHRFFVCVSLICQSMSAAEAEVTKYFMKGW